MASQWFCRVLGQERGPIGFQKLVEMVRAGTLTERDPVRRQGTSEWTRARDVVGLFRAAQRQAAEAASPDPEAPPAPAQPPAEPARLEQSSGKMPRLGRRGLFFLVGSGVVLMAVVLAVLVWRSHRSHRFPEPLLGKPRAVEPDALEALRGEPPDVPSLPGLEERVPQLVPGLEGVETAFSPCLSRDLCTIIFSRPTDSKTSYDLYVSAREDVYRPFGKPRRIEGAALRGADTHPTLSPDGLELLFDSPDELPRLHYCRRESTSSEFSPAVLWSVPRLAPTEQQRLKKPQFVDPLSVVFVRVSTDGNDRTNWIVERNTPHSAFGPPRAFPFAHRMPAYFVSEDRLRAYFGYEKGLLMVARRSIDDRFGEPIPLLDAAVTGPVDGTIWVAPEEDVIFYVSPGPGEELGSARKLWMICF